MNSVWILGCDIFLGTSIACISAVDLHGISLSKDGTFATEEVEVIDVFHSMAVTGGNLTFLLGIGGNGGLSWLTVVVVGMK